MFKCFTIIGPAVDLRQIALLTRRNVNFRKKWIWRRYKVESRRIQPQLTSAPRQFLFKLQSFTDTVKRVERNRYVSLYDMEMKYVCVHGHSYQSQQQFTLY